VILQVGVLIISSIQEPGVGDAGGELEYHSDIDASIRFVRPTFTQAAYDPGGFYDFYGTYGSTGPGEGIYITTDLNLLNTTISSQNKEHSGGAVVRLIDNIREVMPNVDIASINDIHVHSGSIFFGNGTNRYDVLILAHNEYVTQEEYVNLRLFTAQGGTVIFMDGNYLFAEVEHFATPEETVQLVSGHGWIFNGTHAYQGPYEHFATNNTLWTGSNYYCKNCEVYAYDPFGYNAVGHEENYITNSSAVVITDYQATVNASKTVATYYMDYGEGRVIVFGLFAENLTLNPLFVQYFDYVLLQYAFGETAINPLTYEEPD